MPAEQEALDRARVITRVRLNGTPTDLTLLAEAVLSLEAELLAAQEERDSHAKAASEAMAREKALREALDRMLYNAQLIFNKRPVRDWGETLAEAKAALAGSPSEKPGSEEEA